MQSGDLTPDPSGAMLWTLALADVSLEATLAQDHGTNVLTLAYDDVTVRYQGDPDADGGPFDDFGREFLTLTVDDEESHFTVLHDAFTLYTAHPDNPLDVAATDVAGLFRSVGRQARRASKRGIDASSVAEIRRTALALAGRTPERPVKSHPTVTADCPDNNVDVALNAGRLRHHAALTCVEQDGVAFSVEHTLHKDAWGRFDRQTRRLHLTWDDWDVRFVTDPRSDGQGLVFFERPGRELLEIRRGDEVNRFSWYHGDGGIVSADPTNPTRPGEARIRRTFDALRRHTAQAWKQVEPYAVTQVPARDSPTDVVVHADDALRAQIARLVQPRS